MEPALEQLNKAIHLSWQPCQIQESERQMRERLNQLQIEIEDTERMKVSLSDDYKSLAEEYKSLESLAEECRNVSPQ